MAHRADTAMQLLTKLDQRDPDVACLHVLVKRHGHQNHHIRLPKLALLDQGLHLQKPLAAELDPLVVKFASRISPGLCHSRFYRRTPTILAAQSISGKRV